MYDKFTIEIKDSGSPRLGENLKYLLLDSNATVSMASAQ